MHLRYLETASPRGLVGGKEKSPIQCKQRDPQWDLSMRVNWTKSESQECREGNLGQARKVHRSVRQVYERHGVWYVIVYITS